STGTGTGTSVLLLVLANVLVNVHANEASPAGQAHEHRHDPHDEGFAGAGLPRSGRGCVARGWTRASLRRRAGVCQAQDGRRVDAGARLPFPLVRCILPRRIPPSFPRAAVGPGLQVLAGRLCVYPPVSVDPERDSAMRGLIHEIHRRSLWQVVGLYLGVSWGALEVVGGITESAGLPDWVPSFALVLLVIGFPVVIATAFVQKGLPREGGGTVEGDVTVRGAAAEGVTANRAASAGTPLTSAVGSGVLSESATRPAIHHRLFTWRNAILGGIGAFALLGLAVAGYFVMRVTGIGPVASLAAQGVIEPGEPIIIAEFENTSSDPSLGSVVTEALRVDLTGSPALTPLAPARIQEMLRLMQRSPDERLSPALAREVAIREGVRAVLEGEVASAGSGFIVLATLLSPDSQAALATFRRTARSPDEVIDAID